MKLTGYGLTDVGMTREHNEDNFFLDNEKELYIVCDGVGGQNAGEVASKMAVDLINSHFDKAIDDDEPFVGEYDESFLEPTNRLASAIRLANHVVYESARSNAALNGMGSTVVAITRSRNKLCIAHVGDSRLYLLRQGTISQLTDDHSLVMEQLKRGLITEEQAKTSNVKNVITRALGAMEEVDVDLEEIELEQGDKLLMCSDGLSNMVDDDTMLKVVETELETQEACRSLVKLANENGGKDNITVVIAIAEKKGFLSAISNFFK